jgi:hypothetical protein
LRARTKTTLATPRRGFFRGLVYAIPQSELQQPSSDLVVKLTGHFAVVGAPDVKPEVIWGITRSAYNLAHSRAAAVRARSASLGGAAAVENVIELLKEEEFLACFALMEDLTNDDSEPAKERRAWRKYQNLLADLSKIADTMQTSRGSQAKRAGRPPKRDLDRVVGYLGTAGRQSSALTRSRRSGKQELGGH